MNDSCTQTEIFSRDRLDEIKRFLPERPPEGNKYTFGTVLVIAGSDKYPGAAILAVRAALRGGAGLVTAAAPGSVSDLITLAAPDAVRLRLGGSSSGTVGLSSLDVLLEAAEKATACIIGPGLGREPETAETVRRFLRETGNRKVLADADALFALSGDEGPFFEKGLILTPHEGEAARLLHTAPEEIRNDRDSAAARIRDRYRAVTVLKGHETLTLSPDGRKTVNRTGNTALSKGGSGDVLSGLIGALLAQGAEPYDAARLGVFLHGLTGELLSEKKSEFCVLPEDFPDAFLKLL